MSRVLVALDKEIKGDNRVLREISILLKAGHEVLVLCYDFGAKIPAFEFGVESIKIKKSSADKLLPMENRFGIFSKYWIPRIARSIRSFKPDFLIAHDLYMSKPCRKAINQSASNAELILDLHENYPHAVLAYGWAQDPIKKLVAKPGSWQKKEKEYLGYADRIITLSEHFKSKLLQTYSSLQENRFVVFPNFPDVAKLANEGGSIQVDLSDKRPLLFYFGIVGKRRGVFDSLSAFKKVIESGIKVYYLIAGPIDKSDEKTFQEWRKDEVVAPFITYLPWISYSDLNAYFKKVDLNIAPFKVNPQHESGVANKIYQYMYSGKVLIVSDCKPQAEIIEKYQCGKVFKNQSELITIISELAKDASLRKQLGENAKNGLFELMNSSESTTHFLRLFQKEQISTT